MVSGESSSSRCLSTHPADVQQVGRPRPRARRGRTSSDTDLRSFEDYDRVPNEYAAFSSLARDRCPQADLALACSVAYPGHPFPADTPIFPNHSYMAAYRTCLALPLTAVEGC